MPEPMADEPETLAGGLWRWATRHPEWHPGDFGREVASFAVRDEEGLVLVDPLLPEDPDPVLEVLSGAADEGGTVAIVITIPYHVRSAAELARRFDAEVLGHRAVARRLPADVAFTAVAPGDVLRGGMTVHAIGRPRRYEQPVYLPSHRALVFGDAIVEATGALRMWCQDPPDDHRTAWYRDVFAPSARPLLDVGPERILVTHGRPVLADATAALAAALAQPPWFHRG